MSNTEQRQTRKTQKQKPDNTDGDVEQRTRTLTERRHQDQGTRSKKNKEHVQ